MDTFDYFRPSHSEKPISNLADVYGDALVPDWLRTPVSTGTSLLAVEFDGGVVIGADSRTTMGSYIANRVTDKLSKITDKIYCCRSGSAADTQIISDIIAYQLAFQRSQQDEEPLVRSAANAFKEICYTNRDSIMAGIIVAGWDKKLGGQVYMVPLGGMCIRQPITVGGSGSSYMYGYCDAMYKPGITKEECVKLVSNGLTLAMGRDGSSGGCVRLAVIDEKGVDRRTILGTDLPQFHTL